MIPVPSGVRVWLAVGRTDMRRGMNGLALRPQARHNIGRQLAQVCKRPLLRLPVLVPVALA